MKRTSVNTEDRVGSAGKGKSGNIFVPLYAVAQGVFARFDSHNRLDASLTDDDTKIRCTESSSKNYLEEMTEWFSVLEPEERRVASLLPYDEPLVLRRPPVPSHTSAENRPAMIRKTQSLL